jgi:AraC family transcriptional regulator of adaptative response/methylated-DNA-[protein]-cysteine methyltransferase
MNEDLFWQASATRDSRFDGVFFLCVKTTKIYCKPSCSARQPNRSNVEFALTCADAESRGFRACLRCKPQNPVNENPVGRMIADACAMLEDDEFIKLPELSAKLGVSPFHLQRTFKEVIGVSPKKYSEMRRLEKFKSGLRDGSDLTSALYESGFGSSSRLYEGVSEKLGMTPKTYQKGGTGMTITYTVADCELGKMLTARTEKGICAVTFGDDEEYLRNKLVDEYPNALISKDEKNLADAVKLIIDGLAGKTKRIDLPVDVKATVFQMQVWDALRRIPYGETVSYKEVAEDLGNPKAVRAVARACATNKVAVVIPCHRVIGSNGSLSGYRWGIERKRRLLELEKENRSEDK